MQEEFIIGGAIRIVTLVVAMQELSRRNSQNVVQIESTSRPASSPN
jgi:hypothetical protein